MDLPAHHSLWNGVFRCYINHVAIESVLFSIILNNYINRMDEDSSEIREKNTIPGPVEISLF